jgi:excisionase family DNA binding protein
VKKHPDVLTTHEAARLLHASGTKVRAWCNEGVLRHYWIGTQRRITFAAIRSFAREYDVHPDRIQQYEGQHGLA